MAKYKVGDRVRIVSRRPNHSGFKDDMEQYLGKTLTVRQVVETRHGTHYEFDEAGGVDCFRWAFLEDWIAGLAKPKKENGLRVVIRFDGNVTTARLMRGDTIVKTASARRNPADKYSHAKGAALAVERLFCKKSDDKPKESSEPKIGDKFVIVGNSTYHHFTMGEIVTLIRIYRFCANIYKGADGAKWLANDCDVVPYKGESK